MSYVVCANSIERYCYITDRSKCDTSVVVFIVLCLGIDVLCCFHLMCVFIFLLGLGD